jgi:hypothetical protein
MSFASRFSIPLPRLPAWIPRYGVGAILALAMVVCVAIGSSFEREFRANLEQGFQNRVELGDLASAVHQLRKTLDAPRALDPGYISGLIERTKEVESKVKAQGEAGRISDLVLPTKELASIAAMQAGFERLAVSAAQVERAFNVKASLKPSESAEAPTLKRVASLVDDYVAAVGALRNARSSANALPGLTSATMALAENLQAATTESRKKTVSLAWRDVLAALPVDRGDLIDRLLADGRMLEEFQAHRTRSMSRLEQVSAKIDSAERMLLQSRSGGGLLVVASILTWLGIAFGLLAIVVAWLKVKQLAVISEQAAHPIELVVPRSVLAESISENQPIIDDPGVAAEAHLAARIANEVSAPVSVRELAEAALEDTLDHVASGYWIEAGSVAERRVALLDKQSEQLEQHVKAVMASVETLAGRVDLVVQSLQLVMEKDAPYVSLDTKSLRRRADELQALAMNLSIQVTSGEGADPLLDDLEEFNRELEALTEEIKRVGLGGGVAQIERRLAHSIDEGRRMVAAADSLKERTETLYEDAQRFRRHSEALIRGIQDGAVAELPASYIRQRHPA